jgi:hypothetical protein
MSKSEMPKSPDQNLAKGKEKPKIATVKDGKIISMEEQKYIEGGGSPSNLTQVSVMEVVEVKGNRVLVKDGSGKFWVPKEKLDIKE